MRIDEHDVGGTHDPSYVVTLFHDLNEKRKDKGWEGGEGEREGERSGNHPCRGFPVSVPTGAGIKNYRNNDVNPSTF